MVKDFREAFPNSESLDDVGCQRLGAAIILQAAIDYYMLLSEAKKARNRRQLDAVVTEACEIDQFLRGELYSYLTSLPREDFLQTVEYWNRNRKDLKGFIGKWRDRLSDDPECSSDYYDPKMLHDLIYRGGEANV